MNKLTLLLLVAILLTACQPAETPQPTAVTPTETPAPTLTPEPVEALASSVYDLIGVWWFPQGGFKIDYKADGTYLVVSSSANIGQLAEGTYTFDAGKITFTGCGVGPATYEAYVTKKDGKLYSLRMQLIGSDDCSARAKSNKGIGIRQAP